MVVGQDVVGVVDAQPDVAVLRSDDAAGIARAAHILFVLCAHRRADGVHIFIISICVYPDGVRHQVICGHDPLNNDLSLARRGAPLPLARLALKQELAVEYRELLPDLEPDQWRRIRGEQDIIVRYEPEKAIAALPRLLSKAGDRERLITLVRALLGDERMRRIEPTTEQLAMIENLGETLDVSPARGRTRAPARKAASKAARKPAVKRRTGR